MIRLASTLLASTLLCLLWAAAPAAAHTVFVDSSPQEGQTVGGSLDAVILHFNEPVQGRFAEVAVIAPDTRRVDAGSPNVAGTEVTQVIAELHERGVYQVHYRVLAADNHPIRGEFAFEYLGPLPEPGPPAVEQETAERPQPEQPAPPDLPEEHMDPMEEAAPPASHSQERPPILALAALLAVGVAAASLDALRRTRVVTLPPSRSLDRPRTAGTEREDVDASVQRRT